MNSKSYISQQILKDFPKDKRFILDALREVKKRTGELESQLIVISKHFKITKAETEGIATFYSFLNIKPEGKYVIRLCSTISCDLKNRQDMLEAITNETGASLGQTSKDGLFTFTTCHCLGMCDQGPAMLINNQLYSSLTPKRVKEIIQTCRDQKKLEDYTNKYNSNIYKTSHLYDFLKADSQYKYLNLLPNEIISKIQDSSLRGRGGAGFPTGIKWEQAAKCESTPKYVICNADEGEPGTFKDRFILGNFPEKVIEGICIAAKAIGSNKGIIYLRGEYEYLFKKLKEAISKFPLDIEIHLGAGSYVCGEETALIESLEGNRGEPRIKPPYPVTNGFNDLPTVVNNVETFVDAALIIEKGVDYFKELGTPESKGTKFFSISGDLTEPGIYEIPYGATLNELLDICNANSIKSIQVGGASGRNIHYRDFNKTLAFEAIPSGGSIILFNNKRNMMEVAKNFMEFFANESCGQCTSCRVGTFKLLEGIENILEGNKNKAYLSSLVSLGKSIMNSSKCGLGQVCAIGFISIIENWYLND